MKDRRIGRFFVDEDFATLDNLAARRLMERVVILRAEYQFSHYAIEYTALCEDFDPIPQYSIPPEYDVTFSGDPVKVTFVRRRT